MADASKTLGVLLKESFSLFTRHIFSLVKAAFSIYIPLFGMSLLFTYFFTISAANTPPGMIDPAASVRWFFLGIAFFFLMIVLSLLYQVVIIKAIADVDQGNAIRVGDLLKESWDAVSGYLNVALWVLLKVFLWSLLLIVPGIIFAIFYSYASFAFVLDGHRGPQALAYSKKIIKPALGKFLGNMLAVSLLVLPVYMIVSVVVSMVFGIGQERTVSVMPLIGSLLGNMMNVIVGIYPTIFFYLLYRELKRRAAPETPVSTQV